MSSDMALGYSVHDEGKPEGEVVEGLARVLRMAYSTLKPGGTLHVSIGEKEGLLLERALASTKFKGNYVNRPLAEHERKRTYWTAYFSGKIRQFTARKPRAASSASVRRTRRSG